MNTLEEKIKKYPRRLLKDERGWFLKVITGNEENLPNQIGEVYFTCGYKDKIKGSHYHHKAQEWFTIIEGKALLKLEDINTHEKMDIMLDANEPETIFIPSNVAHLIKGTNDCNYFILCAYTDLQYDHKDTIPYIIE